MLKFGIISTQMGLVKKNFNFRAIQSYEPDKRRKKDIEKDLKIESLIQEVQDGNIELLEYLSEVSKLFHFRINRKKD